jgi:hypothetical protein
MSYTITLGERAAVCIVKREVKHMGFFNDEKYRKGSSSRVPWKPEPQIRKRKPFVYRSKAKLPLVDRRTVIAADEIFTRLLLDVQIARRVRTSRNDPSFADAEELERQAWKHLASYLEVKACGCG